MGLKLVENQTWLVCLVTFQLYWLVWLVQALKSPEKKSAKILMEALGRHLEFSSTARSTSVTPTRGADDPNAPRSERDAVHRGQDATEQGRPRGGPRNARRAASGRTCPGTPLVGRTRTRPPRRHRAPSVR